jgi:hypothetical protein
MRKNPERVVARLLAVAMSTLISYALLNRVALIASVEDAQNAPLQLARAGAPDAAARAAPGSAPTGDGIPDDGGRAGSRLVEAR